MENEKLPAKGESWLDKTRSYFTDLQMEMRRVTWPTWSQVRATTTVVILAVFAFAAYFRVVDFVVERAIAKIFTTLTTK